MARTKTYKRTLRLTTHEDQERLVFDHEGARYIDTGGMLDYWGFRPGDKVHFEILCMSGFMFARVDIQVNKNSYIVMPALVASHK